MESGYVLLTFEHRETIATFRPAVSRSWSRNDDGVITVFWITIVSKFQSE